MAITVAAGAAGPAGTIGPVGAAQAAGDQPRSIFRVEIRVIDGDTFSLAGIPVRLAGIDAPEIDEICPLDEVAAPTCGRLARSVAAARLRILTAGAPLSCRLIAVDKHRRVVATCATIDGRTINWHLVAAGYARSWPGKWGEPYREIERHARRTGKGFWACDVAAPAKWLKAKRQVC